MESQQSLKPDKGLKGGSCNRTACQGPDAYYFNKSTRAYYCKTCADAINWPGGWADTLALYGTHLLCELDPESAPVNQGNTEAPVVGTFGHQPPSH